MNEYETYSFLGISSIILWMMVRYIEPEKYEITKEQAYSIFMRFKRQPPYLMSPHYTSILNSIESTNMV